jgi:hypothetical protein
MSSTFSITAASNNIAIDRQQPTTSVAYTVSNASGQEIRGRASLASMPANAPHLSWLAIEGESERPFPIGATEQLRVSIHVPPTAAPGNYTFRLNMIATHNPDETFTEGPTVTVTVPEPVPQPKKFPIWVIPVALVVVAIIAIILVFALRPRAVAVPDVVGMSEDAGGAELEDAGLSVGRVRDEPSAEEVGRIARTDPEAGAEVERDARIDLFLSLGTATPTITPTPTQTPTATPDLPATATAEAALTATAQAEAAIAATATAEAIFQAAIGKYTGTWVRESGDSFLEQLEIDQSARNLVLRLSGGAYYVSGGAALGCPVSIIDPNPLCEWAAGEFPYQGDPINVSLEPIRGLVHDLTITISQDGSTLFVGNQVSWQGSRFATESYVMERQRFTLIEDIQFLEIPSEIFIEAITLPTLPAP